MKRMGLRPCLAAALVAAAALLLPGAARAYTAEQEQACTSDAFRLCSSDIPDVDRVTACMVRRKEELSPPCRAQFGPPPRDAATSGRADRPMSIRSPTAKRQGAPRSGKTNVTKTNASKTKKVGRPAATE